MDFDILLNFNLLNIIFTNNEKCQHNCETNFSQYILVLIIYIYNYSYYYITILQCNSIDMVRFTS